MRAALNQLAAVGLHQRTAQSRPRLRVLSIHLRARVLVPASARSPIVTRTPKSRWWSPSHTLIPYAAGGGRHGQFRPPAPFHGMTVPASVPPLLFEPTAFAVAAPALAKRLRLKPQLICCAVPPTVPLLRCPLEPWSPWFRAAGLDAAEPTTGLKLVDLGLALEAAASGAGRRPRAAQPCPAAGWRAVSW